MSLFSAGKTGGTKYSQGKGIDNTSFPKAVHVTASMGKQSSTALEGMKMGDKSGAPKQGGGKKK